MKFDVFLLLLLIIIAVGVVCVWLKELSDLALF